MNKFEVVKTPTLDQIRDYLKFMGLSGDDLTLTDMAQQIDLSFKFGLIFGFEVNVAASHTHQLESYLESIADRIRNSELVKDELLKKDEEIKKLNEVCQTMATELSRLKPFEEHHKIEMQLRHGYEEPTGPDGWNRPKRGMR